MIGPGRMARLLPVGPILDHQHVAMQPVPVRGRDAVARRSCRNHRGAEHDDICRVGRRQCMKLSGVGGNGAIVRVEPETVAQAFEQDLGRRRIPGAAMARRR